MKLKNADAARRRYQQLRRQLAGTGYISQGSVQDRTSRQGGGAGYQWTRKVAQKTVTVALSAEQFERMKQAVNNYRRLREQIRQMERLSREILFAETPNPHRRKSLPKKVLGTN